MQNNISKILKKSNSKVNMYSYQRNDLQDISCVDRMKRKHRVGVTSISHQGLLIGRCHSTLRRPVNQNR